MAADAKKQDEFFRSHVQNLIDQANARTAPRFSHFLDERQIAMAEEILRHNRCPDEGVFFGGAEDCERVMLGVFPPEIPQDTGCFPIAAIHVRVPGPPLTHRDYLGSLMALQIKRESVGDIVLQGDGAILFAAESVAAFLCTNLERVGRASAQAERVTEFRLERSVDFEECTGTVSSMRLDCVTALLLNQSRSRAAEAIEAGLVRVNGLECLSVSRQVEPEDRISIRGYGRFLLGGELKRTKKDRILLTVRKQR